MGELGRLPLDHVRVPVPVVDRAVRLPGARRPELGQGRLLHHHLPHRAAHHPAVPGRDSARRVRGRGVLHHAPLGDAAERGGVGRRGLSGLLLVRHRLRLSHHPLLVQQVHQQLPHRRPHRVRGQLGHGRVRGIRRVHRHGLPRQPAGGRRHGRRGLGPRTRFHRVPRSHPPDAGPSGLGGPLLLHALHPRPGESVRRGAGHHHRRHRQVAAAEQQAVACDAGRLPGLLLDGDPHVLLRRRVHVHPAGLEHGILGHPAHRLCRDHRGFVGVRLRPLLGEPRPDGHQVLRPYSSVLALRMGIRLPHHLSCRVRVRHEPVRPGGLRQLLIPILGRHHRLAHLNLHAAALPDICCVSYHLRQRGGQRSVQR